MMTKLKFGIGMLALISILAFTRVEMMSTSLKITVRNNLGNTEEGVSVQLFETEEDYRNETNAVTEVQKTDKKGNVRFRDLKPQVYFVNAVKGDMNNVGAGVQTDTLIEGKLNKVTIIIE